MNVARNMLVLALSCSQLGCSFLFVKSPPSPGEVPDVAADEEVCSHRPVAPIVDFVGAVSFGGGILFGAMLMAEAEQQRAEFGSSSDADKKAGLTILASSLVLTGVYLASGIWGLGATRDCRLYRRQHRYSLADWAPSATRIAYDESPSP